MFSDFSSKVIVPLRAVSRSVAILLTVTSIITQSLPAKANPALAAPAACLTGVGCVLLGTVVVGGAAYYLWQSANGSQYYSPIVDDENPDGWEPTDSAPAATIEGCREMARKHGKQLVNYERKSDFSGGYYYVCYFK